MLCLVINDSPGKRNWLYLTNSSDFVWHPTVVLMPRKSHGWRSLVGCSPWGREESDTTERLPFPFSLSCIGEGNGNPLPCSCLENPRDRGAWWAAICGVAQSRTRLKRLGSSGSRNFVSDIPVPVLPLFFLSSWRHCSEETIVPLKKKSLWTPLF